MSSSSTVYLKTCHYAGLLKSNLAGDKMQVTKYVLGGLSIALLAGCLNTTLVKDMTANKEVFLNQNFSSASLNKDVAAQLAKDGTPARFKKMHLKFDLSIENVQGKKETPKLDVTLFDKGNGLIQIVSDIKNNEIPYYLSYKNEYRGLLLLRIQGAWLNQAISRYPDEIKQIKHFTPVPATPVQGDEYSYEFLTGTQPQNVNFVERKLTCKAGATFPANQINTKLVGNATTLECELYRNNVLDMKSTRTYLNQYGVAVPLREVNSRVTSMFNLADVFIE